MKTVKPVELESGQWIYMQVDESMQLEAPPAEAMTDDFERKGSGTSSKVITKLGDMLRAMTDMAANAVNESALGNVEKMTLEFSVTLGGELAIPLVTTGKAEGAINISIEFAKPKPTNSENPTA